MPIKSKSFTGCWTCRSRKIKCDLGTPACRQCLKANIKCEGYSIKLRWSGEADPGNDRRAVEFVKFPPNMLYDTYEEIDLDLNNINISEPDIHHTIVIGPFGLFPAAPQQFQQQQQPNKRRRKRLLHSNPSTPGSASGSGAVQSKGSGRSTTNISPLLEPLQFNTDPTFAITSQQQQLQQPDTMIPRLEDIEQELIEMFPETYMDLGVPRGVPNTENVLFSPEQPSFGQDFPQLPNSNFTMGNSPTLWAQSRYLLQHYKEKLVPVMTFVIHPKNPWSTIYLPRAYNAIADIIADGKTSHARHIILYAQMATSALYIRNLLPEGSPHRSYYNDLGENLQSQAKSGLARILEGGKAKYKDFLCALLSMVTLDLVKGDSGLGVVPLNAAQRLINTRCLNRPVLSRKARILHRICVMLTLLQRSTTFTVQELKLSDAWMDRTLEDVVEPQHDDNTIDHLEKQESRQHTLSYMNDTSQLEQYFSEYKPKGDNPAATTAAVPNTPSTSNYSAQIPNNYEAVSPQLIHGVPESLVFIFKNVIDISRKALQCRTSGLEFDAELTSACTQLESHLESWKSQFELSPPTDLSVPSVNEAVMHHALAFHSTLVVYHYRLAKDVNRVLLQPYLERAIDHLEAIAALNANGTLVALPFFFTGFICACEIQPDNLSLTRRYDNWFAVMREACLSTYSTALQVIAECRRRRGANLGHDNWWEIVEEWGVSLILI